MYMRSEFGKASPVGDSVGSPEPFTWFEASTHFGPLHLSVSEASGAARHAVEAAIALHRCEQLLSALDAWTHLALDWRWTAAPVWRVSNSADARADWQPEIDAAAGESAAPDLQCRIVWPWALLRSLPAPGGALARQLQWAGVPVVLSVARLRIGKDELRLLEPGGAVVLPPSLQPGWHGLLRTVDESTRGAVGVPVALPSPLSPRLVSSDAGAPAHADDVPVDADHSLCEVRLNVLRPVPADRLTGWLDAELDELGPQASLWICATEDEPARCLAIGRPMPWGDGWALAIETLLKNAAP